MNEYYFHLDHLTVGYDKKPLIKDICIGIEKGEIVTLIGPNGSGKSTILKSITRQLKLVGGNVEFDGKNLHELSFRELSTKMAVVLTERMKPELMTCHDIVAGHQLRLHALRQHNGHLRGQLAERKLMQVFPVKLHISTDQL